MPYTTLTWSEAQAMNGLTGMTADDIAGSGFASSGDKQQFPSNKVWHILGYGLLSDTKPQACNLLPDNSNGNKGYYGPGAINYYPEGWLDLQKFGISYPIMANDAVTGQGANTNTNEGAVLGCHVAPGPLAYPTRVPAGEHFAELMTITSAAAVVPFSGAVTPYAAATNTSNWYNAKSRYYLTGVSSHISGATFGGILHVQNAWEGYVPGIPINPLSAVTFNAGQPFTPFPQAIGPLTGLELSTTVKIGMCATSAGAVNFVLHMVRQ